jgi:hypothetical protein
VRARLGASALGVFVLSAGAAACGRGDDADAWSQRDSSGVAVVENARPREGRWAVGVEPVLEIIDGEGGAPLRDPVSVFTDSRGRIHVADRGAPGGGAVFVYDPEGRYLHRARGDGGEGAPAGAGQLWWAAAYRRDSTAILDLGGKRLLVFGPEGLFAREVALPAWRREGAYGVPGYTAGARGPWDDGHFLAYAAGALDRDVTEGPAWYRHDLVRLSPAGERWDTLGVFEIFQTWVGEAWTEPYPFAPVAFAAPHGGGFAFTRGEAFELSFHDTTGAVRRIVRRAHARETVNAADLEQYRSWYLERARASGMGAEAAVQLAQQLAQPNHPARRPAISNLLVDDEGDVWVEEYRWVDPTEVAPDPRPAVWSVFSPEGRWLAQVEVPAAFLLASVSGNRLYGVAVDPAGGKSVRVLTLER